jgi:hypothetical protein
MSDSLQIVIVLLLYFILFGWVGYKRGSMRELIVAIVAAGGYFLLQRYQGAVTTIINLGGKFLEFARGGGLGGDNPDAILLIRDAPDIVTAQQADTVIFVIWAGTLLLTYWLTGRFVRSPKNRSDSMAILLGILNGIFYFSIFLPLLVSIFLPEATEAVEAEDGAGFVLRNTLGVINEGLGDVWGTVGDQQPLLIVFFLTLILVLIASTLRAPKANPRS